MNALSPCAWEQLLDKSYPSSDTAQHRMQPSQMIGIRKIKEIEKPKIYFTEKSYKTYPIQRKFMIPIAKKLGFIYEINNSTQIIHSWNELSRRAYQLKGNYLHKPL